jgi:hypothetical protein
VAGEISRVSLRQHQQSLLIRDHGYPPPRLIQQGFAAGQGAKLLRPVVARDAPGEGKQTFAVATRQNDSPGAGSNRCKSGFRLGITPI